MTKSQLELLNLEAAIPKGERWYLVMAQPSREDYALKNLDRQGFEVFLPQITKRRRRGRAYIERLAPLFPRYLFLRLDLWRDRWRSVMSTYGVSTLIMRDAHPLPIPDSVVEQLLEARDESGGIDFQRSLREGDLVRFRTGPFADLVGRLASLRESDRVNVLLEIMGTVRHVHAERRDLLPVHSIVSSDLDRPTQPR